MDSTYYRNPAAGSHPVVDPVQPADVAAFHRILPGYRPTALRRMPTIAARLGVAEVYAKDETVRLGLPSYKILGASYATYQALRSAPGGRLPSDWTDVAQLREALRGSDLTLVAPTDGNHGRAVAHMAGMLGLASRVLVPAGTAQARIDAIALEGAEVEVVDGTYDEAVAVAAALSDDSHVVVSDTAWAGYESTPQDVIYGYSTLFQEIDDALIEGSLPPVTHAAVQIGVGALAAAMVLRYRGGAPTGPDILGVEPLDAACMLESVRSGSITEVPGPHRSSMAGLNCGVPSPLAFPLAQAGISAFVAIADHHADEAVSWFAEEGLVAGESGAAGLAGLLALRAVDPSPFPLNRAAVVLLVVTEGDTKSPQPEAPGRGSHSTTQWQ